MSTMHVSYMQELPLPVLEVIASNLDDDPRALAALRATCTWCSHAAGSRAKQLRLPYHTPCERMTVDRLERARTLFPGVSQLQLDCSGICSHEEHPLLRAYDTDPRLGNDDVLHLARTLRLWPGLSSLQVRGPHELLLPPLLGLLRSLPRVRSLGLHGVLDLPPIPDVKQLLAGCGSLADVTLDFEGVLPHRYLTALAAAPALMSLRVRLMQVTDVTMDYVCTVAGLRCLEVHASEGMCVTVGGLNQLSSLPRLKQLSLRVDGHASLNNPRLNRMEQLPCLASASLDMKLLDGTWLSWLGRVAPAVRSVRVASPYGTYFTSGAAWQAIAQLPKAKVSVHFGDPRHCRLLECNLEKLSGLTNLESLRVTGATWGPFAFDHLLPLRRLARLHLTGVSFVGRGYSGLLDKLACLPRLEALTLRGRALEEPWCAGPEQADALRKATPSLRRADLGVECGDGCCSRCGGGGGGSGGSAAGVSSECSSRASSSASLRGTAPWPPSSPSFNGRREHQQEGGCDAFGSGGGAWGSVASSLAGTPREAGGLLVPCGNGSGGRGADGSGAGSSGRATSTYVTAHA